jgi:uncharacterized coiled-coil protein SlyX
MVSSEIEHEAFIDSIALDNVGKDKEIDNKNETIQTLETAVSGTLDDLQKNIAQQMDNMTMAIDTLAGNLVNQANAANGAQDQLITALNAQITSLKTENDSLEKRINDLITKNNLKI